MSAKSKEIAEIIRNLAVETTEYILADITGTKPTSFEISYFMDMASPDSTMGRAMRLIKELEN